MNSNYHVLLYYLYVPIAEPLQFIEEHRALCTRLGLRGRILVSEEGINGTVGGTKEACEEYKKALWADERFATMQFKEDPYNDIPFPKLKIKYRKEIVTLGVDVSPKQAGQHLSPEEWHTMAQQDDVVILDARNNFESAVGKFENAITPDIDYFRDFPGWVKEHKNELKGKKVLMYCTGGIRCEKASALVREEGIEEVYQLEGGIIEYGKKVKNGLWRGLCFVFDGRMGVPINEEHDTISQCHYCDTSSDRYYNCCNAECNKLILLCDTCKENSNAACSKICATKHRLGIVKKWNITTREAK